MRTTLRLSPLGPPCSRARVPRRQAGDQERRIRYLDEETELFSYLTDIESVRKVATQVGRATSKGKRGAAGAAGDAPKYAAARTGGTRGATLWSLHIKTSRARTL